MGVAKARVNRKHVWFVLLLDVELDGGLSENSIRPYSFVFKNF